MEHTLRAPSLYWLYLQPLVLILVLVEHTLRAIRGRYRSGCGAVLILVLVEHTLRENESSSLC